MKKIAIAGASGFVGQHLIAYFKDNYAIKVVERDASIEEVTSIMCKSDIVINLAGANITQRWSEEYKEILYDSRIDTTRKLVRAIDIADNKPTLFISTSAVGIYDNQKEYDEMGHFADDFLSTLCQDWEAEALKADVARTIIFRFGIVLGKDGGAISKMLLPFKLGVGGNIGSGKQPFSFIDINDLKRAYAFVIENEEIEGVLNLTAPNPTTNAGLTKALGKALHRPTLLPVPEFVLKIIFSEGAKVLTDGQRVVPRRLLDYGFAFEYPTIESSIDRIIKT